VDQSQTVQTGEQLGHLGVSGNANTIGNLAVARTGVQSQIQQAVSRTMRPGVP
jgi:hypothetical protein